MRFIENIKENFILSPKYNILEKIHRLKTSEFVQPELRVKISDINMDGIKFIISNTATVSKASEFIANQLIKNITADIAKVKKIATKVLDAWEKTPGNFIQRADHDDCYMNKNLLSSDEYRTSALVSFGKVSYFSDLHFTRGCGSDSYYGKEYFKAGLENADKWLSKVISELKSDKIQARISNYFNKTEIKLTYPEVLEYITIPNNKSIFEVIKEVKKPEFPITFSSSCLNCLLSEIGGECVVDDEIIHFCISEFEEDLSAIRDYEISSETNGYHNHDGQVCDYKVTFTSPAGHDYNCYNSHCLITGWNFDGKIKPE